MAFVWPAGEQLTYSEVRERMNATDDDVVRLLHSLSCAKHKVLLKEPSNRTIGKDDSFRLNVKFTDRMRRVKVGPQGLTFLLLAAGPRIWESDKVLVSGAR